MTHQQNVYKGTLCRRGMNEEEARYFYGIERPFGPITKEQHLDDEYMMEMDAAMDRAFTREEENYNSHLDWQQSYY